jgi:hypothetical protein
MEQMFEIEHIQNLNAFSTNAVGLANEPGSFLW